MTQAIIQMPDDLVAMLRRDMSQIQLLADMDALNPENLRQLLGSLGELVNVVETLNESLRETYAPQPTEPPIAAKAALFAALKDRFHHLPATRMQFVGHLGVIDGGLSS